MVSVRAETQPVACAVGPETRDVIGNGYRRTRNQRWQHARNISVGNERNGAETPFVMAMSDGRFVTRVTPAQPLQSSSAEPSTCRARGASLLELQAQLQVSVANHHLVAAPRWDPSQSTFSRSRTVKIDAIRSHRQNRQGLQRQDHNNGAPKILSSSLRHVYGVCAVRARSKRMATRTSTTGTLTVQRLGFERVRQASVKARTILQPSHMSKHSRSGRSSLKHDNLPESRSR